MNFNDESCLMIDILMQEVNSRFSKAKGQYFSSEGLTSQQVSILLLLDQKGAMKISDIAGELKMVDSNCSNICSRLEKAELVQRSRLKDDARIVIVSLTGKAAMKMEDLKIKVNDFRRKLSESVSRKDLEDICKGLAKLNNLLDLFLYPAGQSV